MKYWTLGVMALSLSMISCAQKQKQKPTTANLPATDNAINSLLWKISGNGLEKPSYLFGTIHLLCADDAHLSENMKKVISEADEIYFEVDMDNLLDMFGAVNKMKMKGDTTLRDLLIDSDYQKVKAYFEQQGTMIPFTMLEKYKPILAASMLESGSLPCENTAVMEQVIMQEAKEHDKNIKGLETMAFQAGILDSIPYKLQAEQLLQYVNDAGSGKDKGDTEMSQMWKAYNDQDLKKLEELMIKSDLGINNYTDLLLYRRNSNWVKKLKGILPEKSVLIAVGAGHLPGEKGVISLLRKAGYTLTPVENKRVTTKEI
jgi:uncharacterized protein YbaP (TraB family)